MRLPENVSYCIAALEAASYPTYAVGGCVRDPVLGLTPQDFDLCTAALPEQMQEVFADRSLVLAGLKHGTVGVIFPDGVVEITTFRTEGGYADCRHPDWVRFVSDIEEDLARRDFTVNAMAWSPTRGFSDPFGGQNDLKNRILRAVGNPEARFREDSLRILRGARFAAKYRLTPDADTETAMISLAPLMENLARERVFSELCKLLTYATVEDLIRWQPLITQVIPELAGTVGFDQHSHHHAYDLYTHIAHVTAASPATLEARWAALLHDVGKVATFTLDEHGNGHFYGHAQLGGDMANDILLRLKAPTALRQQVVALVKQHMTRLEPDKKLLRRWLSRLGCDTVLALLALQEADMGSKGTGIPEALADYQEIHALLDEIQEENACLRLKDLAINGHDLIEMGFSGKALGACLNYLLEQVLDEQLPNEPDALRTAANAILKQGLQDLPPGGKVPPKEADEGYNK